ncbi:MAG: hypothetical protein KI793_25300 [Rivularia sp. (in: Bacteria)]|nr:hypothetical protein [Rivularia sp. MS3]
MHTIAIDNNTQNIYPQIVFTLGVDFSQFENPELQSKAKNTFHRFISFVRKTFNDLMENRKLIHLSLNTILLLALFGKVFVYS